MGVIHYLYNQWSQPQNLNQRKVTSSIQTKTKNQLNQTGTKLEVKAGLHTKPELNLE